MDPVPTEEKHLGWYSRGYLPHLDCPGHIQAITNRLADSLPSVLLKALKAETQELPSEEKSTAQVRSINRLLDEGRGACTLRHDAAAKIVQDSFLQGHSHRYELQSWVVMPNHVHVLIRAYEGHSLAAIIGGWKKWSAREINIELGRQGRLWSRDYFDRFQRNSEHQAKTIRYIEHNPVKAGLCAEPSQWKWSSAHHRKPNGAIDWNLIAAIHPRND